MDTSDADTVSSMLVFAVLVSNASVLATNTCVYVLVVLVRFGAHRRFQFFDFHLTYTIVLNELLSAQKSRKKLYIRYILHV